MILYFFCFQESESQRSPQDVVPQYEKWDNCHGYDKERCKKLLEEIEELREILKHTNTTLLVSTQLY